MIKKSKSSLGKYFRVDLSQVDEIALLGGGVKAIFIYLIIARFASGKDEKPGTRSSAGINAINKLTGYTKAVINNNLNWLKGEDDFGAGQLQREFITSIQIDKEEMNKKSIIRWGITHSNVPEIVYLPNAIIDGYQKGKQSKPLKKIIEGDGFFNGSTLESQLHSVMLLLHLYRTQDLVAPTGVQNWFKAWDKQQVESLPQDSGLSFWVADDPVEKCDESFIEETFSYAKASDNKQQLLQHALSQLKKYSLIHEVLTVLDGVPGERNTELAYTLYIFDTYRRKHDPCLSSQILTATYQLDMAKDEREDLFVGNGGYVFFGSEQSQLISLYRLSYPSHTPDSFEQYADVARRTERWDQQLSSFCEMVG